MSEINVYHEIARNPPEEVGQIMYYDLEVKIRIVWSERNFMGQLVDRLTIEWESGGRMMGDFDDDVRAMLIRNKRIKPVIPRLIDMPETPVTEINIPDPHGFLEWLGMIKRDGLLEEMKKHIAPKQIEPETRIYVGAYKAGRCFNGAHRDGGTIVHLVPEEPKGTNFWGDAALCGTKPGARGYGWASTPMPTTCPKCLLKKQKEKL